MQLNFSWVKDNPGKTAAIVIIGGLAAYFLLTRGASASASVAAPGGVSDSVAAAQIASGTQLQLAGMQLQSQSNQYAAQFQGLQEQDAANYALATLNTQLQALNISAGAAVSAAQIEAQRTVDLAQISANVQQTTIGAQTQAAIAKAAQDAAVALGLAQTNANVAIANVNAAQTLGIAQAMSSTQIAIANYQYLTAKAQAKYSYKTTKAVVQAQSGGIGTILSGIGGILGAL